MIYKTGNLGEIAKQHWEDIENPKPRVFTGFQGLDKIIGGGRGGIRYSDFAVVAGGTGQFKSTLCSNILVNAVGSGNKAALYTYEMSNLQYFRRMLCSEAQMPLKKIENKNLTPVEETDLKQIIEAMAAKTIFLVDSGIDTVEKLLVDMADKRKNGIDLFIVDYVQLLRSSKGFNRVEQMENISRSLKMAALQMDAVVIGISQFSRQHKRDGKEPELHDLRGGSIEYDVSEGIFVTVKSYHRMFKNRERVYLPPYREASLFLSKNRDGESEITVPVVILPSYFKFANIDMSDGMTLDQCDEITCTNTRCGGDDFIAQSGEIFCNECGTIYDEDCSCNDGIVLYHKFDTIDYTYIGLCGRCARGRAILNSIKNTNALIEKEEDRISALPLVYPPLISSDTESCAREF